MASAALLDGTGLPPELNAHILQHLGARLGMRQLLTLCGVSRSAREAIEKSSLALCFSRTVLGAGYGRWTKLLQLVAQRCPAVIQLEFSSCDVDSVAISYLRSGSFPALNSVRLLRCYHLRAPYDVYNNNPKRLALPINAPSNREPESETEDLLSSQEQQGPQKPQESTKPSQRHELQLRELVALNLNVLDHAGFSLLNVQTLAMTGCESSIDDAQSLGLLNLLQHNAPQLRHLFLGGAKLQLYSAGREISVPQVQLCEMTFWEDELKLHAGSLLPNAKIVDLTDLNTLKTGDIVTYDRALPWDCAVECRGRRGVRPLHLAAIAGDSEAVSWLLCARADCNAKDAKGCTALFRACQHGSSQAAQHLLDAGADYLLQNQSLETPLYIASLCGFFSCVDALLKADSAGRNQLAQFDYFDGWSPLHAACLKGSFEISQALLDAGFDANALNKWRQAPMHVCARSGNIALAELLYSHSCTSADAGEAEAAVPVVRSTTIDQADVDDLTPARIAYDRGHHEMVVWLAERGATVPTAKEDSKRRGRRRQKKKRGTLAQGRGVEGATHQSGVGM